MRDLVDILQKGNIGVCPECADYDSDGYEYFEELEVDNIDDVSKAEDLGLTLCGLCGRYFR